MTDTNLFEAASREKYRFPSRVGLITVEDLWDLPLTSQRADKPSLDDTAKRVNAEVKNVAEESFVVKSSNPAKKAWETKLEIVKYVISVRQAENEAKTSAREKAEKKQRILALISEKDDEALKSLSRDELAAQAAALD